MTAEGDAGTRNDGASPAQTATILVQRAPCGRWQHKSWKASPLEWGNDSNGDPEPIAPKDATEIVQWVDECAATTKPDEKRIVPYTLVSDEAVEVEDGWNRKAEYRAYSTCAGGTDSPLLSGERALPRHWSVPGDLDGGTMTIELTGGEAAGLPTPGTVTPGSTTALRLPVGGGVSLSVSGVKDTDTYSYWNVPEKTGDDAIKYKWTVTDEEGEVTELATAAMASWSSTAAGTFVITGTVDDAWGVDEEGVKESGVSAPDLGERNDDEVIYVVAVTVVAKEWSAGKEIGFRPAEDEDGKRIEPVEWVEDGKLVLPKLGDATKAIPGEAVELEVATASDWDAWERAGIDSDIADDSGALTYKWSLTGGKFRIAGENGTFTEATESTGLKVTWLAPAVAEGEENSFTVTCTIDDGTLPRVTEPEIGSHDDEPLERTVSIEVVLSYWAPEDKGIGFHPTLDENDVPVKPYQWNEDGRITAPIDQRVEDAPEEKVVLPGESVTATIEAAQDWDTLTTLEGKTIERDEALTYVWSSGGVGHFLVKDEDGNPVLDADGKPTTAATAEGLSVTWVAPDDIDEDTDVELKCTIDDGEGTPVVAPAAGTRDDGELERIVKVKVVLPKVEFAGLARSCAGGVAVDGVHDFTITGTAKLGDGTVRPNVSFKLVFEGNKGHDYSGDAPALWPKADWKAKDIRKAKFVTIENGQQKLVEELTVTTDENGQFPVQVLSSDIISSDIKVKVKRVNDDGEETEVGEKECDFGKTFSFRGFWNEFNPNEIEDKGWKFNLRWLRPNVETTAKVYLQFKVKANGGVVPENLKRVNGHKMWFDIESVEPREGKTLSNNKDDYATFLAPTPDGFPIHATRNDGTFDGAATAILRAGPKISEAQQIWVIAYDQNQWDE